MGNKSIVIGKGQMPDITADKGRDIHIVYGSSDSILYVSSPDGKTFTEPSLVAVLPGLFASAMRGPQIAAISDGLIVTACTNDGNIFSYRKKGSGKWIGNGRVNDKDESAKEALMGLSADGENVFAVWLGVRDPKGQNIMGAASADGGKTWRRDILVYASPDKTVCECCKPSVAMKGNTVYVMFRNWLNGNRDLYLIKSGDGGRSFANALKLGTGSWKLNGCPMDGGGLAINHSGIPETVWRRADKIYTATPGLPERKIGEGRTCSIETAGNGNIYAWTENGNVVVRMPGGIKQTLGKGMLPLLKALNIDHVLCVWENDRQIRASVLAL